MPPGEYLLMVESFGIAGEYSFCVHTAGSENGLETGSETEDPAVSPASDQPSGTDPAAASSGDESSDSPKAKGALSWLKENLLSPETFIGAIIVGVLVNKISDLLSKKKD